MKKIGFLSFGHWSPSPRSATRSARDNLLQSIDLAQAAEEIPQHYPRHGWVEHDPEDLWRTTLSSARAALARAGVEAREVAAIGIANQRETVVLWDRATGQPVAPAIVWQDRRTTARCEQLRRRGQAALIQRKTGLVLDAYFSATKLEWLLDQVPGARARAEAVAALREHEAVLVELEDGYTTFDRQDLMQGLKRLAH